MLGPELDEREQVHARDFLDVTLVALGYRMSERGFKSLHDEGKHEPAGKKQHSRVAASRPLSDEKVSALQTSVVL